MQGRSATFQLDRSKFKEIILLISKVCDPTKLGAVKLHKIFYFSDMLSFAVWGHPITGSVYRKRDYGPTSDYLLPALRELQQEGAIRVSAIDYFGYRKTTYLPQREPDLTRLTKDEQDLINDMADFVANQNTAKTISELSHNRAWELAEFGDEIPYHTAFALFPTEVSQETAEWAASVASEIETERSKRPAVDYPLFADLRGRVQPHSC
jgi:hypothetical protein